VTDPIVIVPYDSRWPRAYEEERRRLERALVGADVVIEHVGSTAVPGLGGKPILDVMVGVSSLARVEARIPTLEESGYHYVPEYEASLPERRYFRKPHHRPRTHHLHCVRLGGPFWLRHLAFRDRLRADPELAKAYFELKLRLASEHAGNRSAYTEAKSPFIESVLAEADGAARTGSRRSCCGPLRGTEL
jgi:GrpB-like predicted nucleotidyltransferase (UPF0157 family)